MSPEVTGIFRPLYDQLAFIRMKWGMFRQVFGTDAERIELVNRFAAGFFGVVQLVMYDDLVQSLFRLTDPALTGRHPNLSLDRLAEVVAAAGTPIAADVQARSQAIDDILTPFADWRDHRTAHNDLATAQACHLELSSLQGPSRATIEDVLVRAGDLMNVVAVHYGLGPASYEGTILPDGDGDALIRRFQDLARHRDAQIPPEVRAMMEDHRRASQPPT
jgi:hypothetical protein